MSTIAQGADQVRALEQALGGEPPDSAAIAAIQQDLMERYTERAKRRAAVQDRAQRARAARDSLGAKNVTEENRAQAKAEAEDARRRFRDAQPAPIPSGLRPVVSRFDTGSSISTKGAPFSPGANAFAGDPAVAKADENGNMFMQSGSSGESHGNCIAMISQTFLATADSDSARLDVNYAFKWH